MYQFEIVSSFSQFGSRVASTCPFVRLVMVFPTRRVISNNKNVTQQRTVVILPLDNTLHRHSKLESY